MTAAGDVEQNLKLVPGSAGAVVLHTGVGAAMAALGGGNALQGALGAGASEASLPYLAPALGNGVRFTYSIVLPRFAPTYSSNALWVQSAERISEPDPVPPRADFWLGAVVRREVISTQRPLGSVRFNRVRPY